MASVAEMKPHALSEVHGHAAARVIVVVPGSMMASMAEMKPHVRSEVHGCAAVPVVCAIIRVVLRHAASPIVIVAASAAIFSFRDS